MKSLRDTMNDIKIKAGRSWRVKFQRGGLIRIPAAIRRSLDMQPGDEVELIVTVDGTLYFIPAKNRPKAYGKLHKLASKVLQNEDSATLWLNETQFGLNGARPVEHMKTRKGAKEVETLLMRIEYGVWA